MDCPFLGLSVCDITSTLNQQQRPTHTTEELSMKNLIAASLALFIAVSGTFALADQDSKYSTKEVMKVAMKGGLLKKVASGDASDEEKAKLTAMLEALAKNTPKKGSEESWKKLTGALVKAAKAGDGKALMTASNCKACHTPHK